MERRFESHVWISSATNADGRLHAGSAMDAASRLESKNAFFFLYVSAFCGKSKPQIKDGGCRWMYMDVRTVGWYLWAHLLRIPKPFILHRRNQAGFHRKFGWVMFNRPAQAKV